MEGKSLVVQILIYYKGGEKMSASDNLGIKTFDQLVADTLQTITDANVGITNTSPGSVVRTLVEAILDSVDATNYYASYIYDAMSINDATGNDLDRLVLILGITREQASPATSIVTFSTGDEPYQYDISIPYGFELSTRQDTDGTIHTFKVDEEDIILKAGETSIDVKVVCDEVGHLYLPSGAINTMSRSIIGIASAINKSEVNSGRNEETDDELRKRTKAYITAFGKCTDDALKVAVEDIDGVTNCTVVDRYDGVGTSGVIVVPEIIPVLDSVAEEVANAIAVTKASGIKVFIIYPTIKWIDIDLTITDIVDDTIILEAISNYINSLEVGQTFVVRQMERKVLNAIDNNDIDNDSVDIETTVPDTNVSCESEEIIRVKTVTINGEVHEVG